MKTYEIAVSKKLAASNKYAAKRWRNLCKDIAPNRKQEIIDAIPAAMATCKGYGTLALLEAWVNQSEHKPLFHESEYFMNIALIWIEA